MKKIYCLILIVTISLTFTTICAKAQEQCTATLDCGNLVAAARVRLTQCRQELPPKDTTNLEAFIATLLEFCKK